MNNMSKTLTVSLGQYSTAGIKPQNEDFYAPRFPQRQHWIARASALPLRWVSASEGGKDASQIRYASFLTLLQHADSWSTKHAATRCWAR